MEQLNHKLDVNKIQTLEDVRNIFECMNLYSYADEDNERYEVLKKYFTIPYEAPKFEFKLPRKSLEEIQQELDEKFDKLIEKTHLEYRIGHDWLYKKRRYEDFCKRQDEDFEYAKEHGKFKERIRLASTTKVKPGSYLVSGDNGVTWTTTYNFGNGNAGYWYIQHKKPNFVVRFCMNKLLNFTWVDGK